MLTDLQKEQIRNVKLYDYSYKEKKGKAITDNGKQFIIPSFVELKQIIFSEIMKLGFSKIEIVKPSKANCIIRVYQKLHYNYDFPVETNTYNLYGAHCYTLKSGKWTTSAYQDDAIINFSEFTIRHWICQDDYIDFNCDFFDCYVQIS